MNEISTGLYFREGQQRLDNVTHTSEITVPTLEEELKEIEEKGLQGKECLVIGAGPKAASWKERGIKTLDINPVAEADITADANSLEPESIGQYDCIISEALRINPTGKEGVSIQNLVNGVYKCLKSGGVFIYKSAMVHRMNAAQSPLPSPSEIVDLLIQNGFSDIQVYNGDSHAVINGAVNLGDTVLISEPSSISSLLIVKATREASKK